MNNQRQALLEALLKVQEGFEHILEAVSNFYSEFQYELIENIFNGGTENYKAYQAYQKCFRFSFIEEYSLFISLIDDYAKKFKLSFEKNGYPNGKDKNILFMLKGLKLSEEGLRTMVNLSEDNPNLIKELKEIETENHLFKEQDFETFQVNFTNWANAFREEIKENIGEEKYNQLIQPV